MELVEYPNSDYKFDDLELASPQAMQGGGAYFAKIMQGKTQPIIQFPRCTTKSGIVFTKRTTYLDLMYESDESVEIVTWCETLVKKVCSLIDEKKSLWFSNNLTSEDISNMCNSAHRDYKSSTKILIRASIDTHKGSNDLKCKIYDDDEKIVLDQAVIADKVLRDIIPLVSIDGIKFTARSIDIELKVKQLMLMETERAQSPACLIKRATKKIDIMAIPPQSDDSADSECLVKSDPVVDNIIADEGSVLYEEQVPVEEITIANPQTLEEVDIGFEEVSQDLSDFDSESHSDAETQTSTAISESHTSVNDNRGLEEVTLGDLSDFPDTDEKVLNNAITEVNIELTEASDAMKLKQPNEVYLSIYKNAKIKANQMRKAAVEAYLEAKQIKTKYMLDVDDSDDDDLDIYKLST